MIIIWLLKKTDDELFTGKKHTHIFSKAGMTVKRINKKNGKSKRSFCIRFKMLLEWFICALRIKRRWINRKMNQFRFAKKLNPIAIDCVLSINFIIILQYSNSRLSFFDCHFEYQQLMRYALYRHSLLHIHNLIHSFHFIWIIIYQN